jgi:hypothetical protein
MVFAENTTAKLAVAVYSVRIRGVSDFHTHRRNRELTAHIVNQ